MYPYIAKKYDTGYWYKIWEKKGHLNKPLVTNYYKIDIHDFIKKNKKSLPGIYTCSNEEEVLVKIRATNQIIKVEPAERDSYCLKIEVIPCRFGGERYFIHCLCGKRCRFLYLAAQHLFCRKCLGLKYLSQKVPPNLRYLFMKDKIEERFKKGKGGQDVYGRPYYMHHKTYHKLKDRALDYESKAFDYLNKIFCDSVKYNFL